jgi:hypothetical protein
VSHSAEEVQIEIPRLGIFLLEGNSIEMNITITNNSEEVRNFTIEGNLSSIMPNSVNSPIVVESAKAKLIC